ncbi:MAG: SDR family oxidoreductase, partial [Pseudomonadota bacterium]|nr:SDR family oxidoreductase [Pseudomonadota bacterium]
RSAIAARGVTINGLLPGVFDTDRVRNMGAATAARDGKTIDEVLQGRARGIPARRLGTPAEFGAICAFLCSVHAAYLTGQNVLADGGAYPGTY